MKKPVPTSAKDTFSQNIGLVRRVKNLSQEKLAETADLHRTYVGQIERGDVTPTLDAAERVAQALNLELWEVLHPDFSLDAIIHREQKKGS
ncbi:helix-turn-helix domain-containing protein [Pseudoduganella sp. DS3]|uniref:Helix-turn-helix domain-containing protein n=1 Tax=Pseudoduganella guangdongensis TaxID=2692179 RepID=A0A6N9HM07_9BURK|nr:helix-turn-helix transcriptional regulator [Pseudoduganella guangdongensis]MYN04399.1 helix-turn-helix domain-containing protein [Pseudoduganella guangdongensis]